MRNCNSFFPKHEWSKWKLADFIKTTKSYGIALDKFNVTLQVRVCNLCGLQETRPLVK